MNEVIHVCSDSLILNILHACFLFGFAKLNIP